MATEVSLSPFGSDYPYSRIDVLASKWWTLPSDHVLRLHFFGGAISGRAPFFERYNVADLSEFRASRVLGLDVERRSAPNFFHTDVGEIRYGDYAAKVDVEYRVPLYRGSRAVFGIDLSRAQASSPSPDSATSPDHPAAIRERLSSRSISPPTSASRWTRARAASYLRSQTSSAFCPASARQNEPRSNRATRGASLGAAASDDGVSVPRPHPAHGVGRRSRTSARGIRMDAAKNELYVSLAFRDRVDEEIQRKLSRGLPTTIVFTGTLYRRDVKGPVSTTVQTCRSLGTSGTRRTASK